MSTYERNFVTKVWGEIHKFKAKRRKRIQLEQFEAYTAVCCNTVSTGVLPDTEGCFQVLT